MLQQAGFPSRISLKNTHNMPQSASQQRSSIVINASSNALFFIAQIAVVFFTAPILVHGLGDEHYAAWLLTNSVVAYMAMAELGVGASVVRYISRFDGLHDQQAINYLFSTSLTIFAAAGSMVLIASLVLAWFWTQPFGVSQEVAIEMRWMLAILGVNLAIGLPLGTYKSVLIGLERFPVLNGLRIAALVLRNVLFVAAVTFGGGLKSIALVILVTSLMHHAASLWVAHRCLPGLRFSLHCVNWDTLRTIRGYSGYVFMTIVVCSIASSASVLVTGAFLAPVAVTYIGIASSLFTHAGDSLRSTIAVLTPRVSRWEAVGADSAIARLLVSGTRYLLYLTMPATVGLVLLGHPFISLWMGSRYADASYTALVVLALSLPLGLAQAMGSRILEGVGKVDQLFWFNVVHAVLTVAGAAALVVAYGIVGVALATSVAIMVQSCGVILLACRAARVNLRDYLERAWLPAIYAAALLCGEWLVVLWIAPKVGSWLSLIMVSLAAMALYVPIVLLTDAPLRRFARQMFIARAQRTAGVENA
jgi:O-antigen/teichoic acid export membrane protein